MTDQIKQEWLFYDDPNAAADLFCALGEEQYSALALRAKKIKVEGNVQVLANRSPARAVYLLKSGRAGLVNCAFRSVLASPDGPHPFFFLIETLTSSHCEGELRTITSCEFGVLEGEDLCQFLRDQPEVCFHLIQAVSHLYQITVRNIAETVPSK